MTSGLFLTLRPDGADVLANNADEDELDGRKEKQADDQWVQVPD